MEKQLKRLSEYCQKYEKEPVFRSSFAVLVQKDNEGNIDEKEADERVADLNPSQSSIVTVTADKTERYITFMGKRKSEEIDSSRSSSPNNRNHTP